MFRLRPPGLCCGAEGWFDYDNWKLGDSINASRLDLPAPYDDAACGIGNNTHNELRGVSHKPYRDATFDILAHLPHGKQQVNMLSTTRSVLQRLLPLVSYTFTSRDLIKMTIVRMLLFGS